MQKKEAMRSLAAVAFAVCQVAGVGAAPSDAVTQSDLRALLERLERLEAENAAQAKRIAELESRVASAARQPFAVATTSGVAVAESGTTVSPSGRVYETASGCKYYLADRIAGIFEPLSPEGQRVRPYGNLMFEIAHNTRNVDGDWVTDFVRRHGNHNTTISMQDSQFGLVFDTPEKLNGWTFSGRAEFDLVGATENKYDFHWRHAYFEAAHESGWSFLFGQTWHLWKMVSPGEIDGAWLENTGHPYRRSPQVRVTRKWKCGNGAFEWRIGAVKGGPGMGGDRDRDGIEDNSASSWALVESALIYDRAASWNTGRGEKPRRWRVGVAGMYGRDRSHRLSDVDADGAGVFGGREDDYDSKMALVAAQVPFGDFTFTGQLYAGENLGGIGAGCSQRVAFRDIGRRGREVGTVGGFAELGYELNATWSFATGYGFDDPSDSRAKDELGIYYNDRAYIAAFYRVTANFRLGLEYARLRTRYSGDGNKEDDRVQFSAWYNF